MFQVMHPFGGKVLTGNIETWGNTATCKLWRPVVLWWFVHQHHAWSGRTWHLSRVIYVCVSGVVRISTDGLPHVKQRLVAPGAVSSVSISVDIYWYLLISIDIYWIYESIWCDDNFVADNFLLIPYTTEVVSGAKDPRRKLRKTHHVRMLSRPLGLPSDTMLWKSKGVHGATSMPSRKLSLSAQNFAWNLASNKWPRETCGHATGRWAKLAIWLVAEPTPNKNSTQNESVCYWR